MWRRARRLWLVFFSVCALGSSVAQAADVPAPKVELDCKLVPERGAPRRAMWLVELRDSAGRPLRQALRMAGDTVRFKGLLPVIYRICLLGRGGRRYSISVDVTPAPGKGPLEFAKALRVSDAAVPPPGELHVDLATLAISKEAVREVTLAEKATLNDDDAEAERHLQRATDLAPAYADAWNNLGACHYRKGDYRQALREFARVTELKPDTPTGWTNLGAALLAAGRYDEAVEAGKNALQNGAVDALTHAQLGFALYSLRKYAEARKHLERAVELDPAMAEAPQLLLAQIALREQADGRAISYLQGYLALHPNSSRAEEVSRTIAALSGDVMAARGRSRK